MQASPNDCAREVLDVVPLVMRSMRAEFRRSRGNDLRVPQFRAMLFINRNPGASLSGLADHLGLTPPSTSKMVDGLVSRELVKRLDSPADRRKITLTLTEAGARLLEASFQATQDCFAEQFSKLAESERLEIIQAMQRLRLVFSPAGENSKEGASYGDPAN